MQISEKLKNQILDIIFKVLEWRWSKKHEIMVKELNFMNKIDKKNFQALREIC